MGEHDALLWNILSEPADDTARLVFADWLGESGQGSLAEFIREQVEGDRCRNKRKRQQLLRRTERQFAWHAVRFGDWKGYRELLDGIWSARVSGGRFCYGTTPATFTVHRGFISAIELPHADFLKHAKAIFSAHPVVAVQLTDRDPIDGHAWSRGLPVVRPRGGPLRPRRLTDEQIQRGGIRNVIFRHLPGVTEHMNWRDFEDPWAALSLACVAYGRELAGLPALKPQPELVPA